jgi:hypothetical protein
MLHIHIQNDYIESIKNGKVHVLAHFRGICLDSNRLGGIQILHNSIGFSVVLNQEQKTQPRYLVNSLEIDLRNTRQDVSINTSETVNKFRNILYLCTMSVRSHTLHVVIYYIVYWSYSIGII